MLTPLHFKEVFQTTGYHRIQLIKHGVAASTIMQLAKSLRIDPNHLIATLGLPKTTVARKILRQQYLSIAHAERVIGLAKMIGQVEVMMNACEVKNFDVPQWLGSWLYSPHPALGDRQPEEFMDTYTGQEMVSTLLFQMQSSAFA